MQMILETDLSVGGVFGLLSRKARENSRSSMGDGFVKASAFQLGASVSPFSDSLREKAEAKISRFAFYSPHSFWSHCLWKFMKLKKKSAK